MKIWESIKQHKKAYFILFLLLILFPFFWLNRVSAYEFTNVKFADDAEGKTLVWDSVEGAVNYGIVCYKGEYDPSITGGFWSTWPTGNSLNIKTSIVNGTGYYTYLLSAFDSGGNVIARTHISKYFVSEYLDTPTNIKLENGVLSFDPVAHATSYHVILYEKNLTTNKNTLVKSGTVTEPLFDCSSSVSYGKTYFASIRVNDYTYTYSTASINSENFYNDVEVVDNLQEYITAKNNPSIINVKLGADINLSGLTDEGWIINSYDRTLDLNGYTLSMTTEQIKLNYYTANAFTFRDSSISKSGKIISNTTEATIKTQIMESNPINYKLYFNDGNYINNNSLQKEFISLDSSINGNEYFQIKSGNFDVKYIFDGNATTNVDLITLSQTFSAGTGAQVISTNGYNYNQPIESIIDKEISYVLFNTNEVLSSTLISDIQTSATTDKIIFLRSPDLIVSYYSLNNGFKYGDKGLIGNVKLDNVGSVGSIQIKDVTIDSSDFNIIGDTQPVIEANSTDKYSFKIEARANLNAGVYLVNATVVDMENKIYNGQLHIEIARKEINTPGYQILYYTGLEQEIVFNEYDTNLMTLGGTLKGINAGEYKAIFTLKDPNNYKWANLDTIDKEVPWIISRALITSEIDIPDTWYYGDEITLDVTYNPENQPVQYHIFDMTTMTILQSLPTDVGNYAVAGLIGMGENYLSCATPMKYFSILPREGVVVTIKENSADLIYNGQIQDLSGYTFEINDLVYTANDFTFSGNALVSGSNVGSYDMNLNVADFSNINSNFKDVVFEIVDGKLNIKPIENLTVNIIANDLEKNYNGAEHQVTGYSVEIDNPLYTINDFTFSGEAIAKGVDAGTYSMNLKKDDFVNTNTNFENVVFNILGGNLKINPVSDVTVNIVGNIENKIYSGSEQEVSGYSVKIENSLYDEKYFTFNGEAIAKGIDVGTYSMNLKKDDFVNNNPNFENVIFNVTDGKLVIDPKDIVSMIGISYEDKIYDGNKISAIGTPKFDKENVTLEDVIVEFKGVGSTKYNSSLAPSDAGTYLVTYTIREDHPLYTGMLLNELFTIKKITLDIEKPNNLVSVKGEKLNSISMPEGFVWEEPDKVMETAGKKIFIAKYIPKDTVNYEIISDIEVPVIVKDVYNIDTVASENGIVYASNIKVVEGQKTTITIKPNENYQIDKILINGVEKLIIEPVFDILPVGNTIVSVNFSKIQYNILVNADEGVSVNPNGMIKVGQNESQTFDIVVNHGYVLKSVQIDGVEKIDEIKDNKIIFENIYDNHEIVIESDQIIYEVQEVPKDSQFYEDNKKEEVAFELKESVQSNLTQVYINDMPISIDDYEIINSTIVLKNEYLDELENGLYTIKFVFADGGIATTVFELNEPLSSNIDLKWILYSSLIVLILTVLYLYIKSKKKK